MNFRDAPIRMIREKAKAENEFKSVLLGAVSHELRTPMNGIIGFTKHLLSMKEL